MISDDGEAKDEGDGPIIVWLRNDLRLDDNPALFHAAETGRPVVPVVIHDEEGEHLRRLGGAHRWWLHRSLEALAPRLQTLGSPLILRRGQSAEVLVRLAQEVKATSLYINRRLEPPAVAQDDAVEKVLPNLSIARFVANFLHDPTAILTGSGTFYKVFKPFREKVEGGAPAREPWDPPKKLKAPDRSPKSDELASWKLLPQTVDWAEGFGEHWKPGEEGALERLEEFCDRYLQDYKAGRDRPSEDASSRLSPHLRWGEVSPFRVLHTATKYAKRRASIPQTELANFRSELLWRDFNYHVLFHVPDLPSENLNPKFDKMRWRKSKPELKAWQRGKTGYPIIDAGMRQLWTTGWLHNRLRMIVASFLTRDLLIDWRDGEAWFWDTLVDGDIANNTAQWQWIAGTGADAQPFFRIFNPVTQSEKFDPKGGYIRRYVPELAKLPNDALHAPWLASDTVLARAGVELGKTYPKPIVDHGEARARALKAYEVVKN
ncbi:cryptochrome/photolyase family protein [Aureimonas jatrophae]|uniref:Deoxyribodipyrimidine photo-lyase n=1 Tax=Aureimonas jatrophae TaxID=1166073 RepID=A0A1H0GVD9_9HYPH|nr:deoxyribodipyrimidine photo-lyase [Aureimonas jatrophae]MBB3949808.1 deoxyribodipyrimidine photo-lyase [Aureimonas jatrophae]SDO10784.1 deoxyribodipyrimidine photo-lyase type I [Aureimonas jatrophae]